MGNYVKVPADLGSWTHYDPASEADPASAGLTAADRENMWRAVKNLYRSGTQTGISFCLRRRGQVVLNRSLGWARGGLPGSPDERMPMLPETPVCLFSASKAVTAVCVHLLAEQGQIGLDDPIALYIPEFAQKGKSKITIRSLLAHRGGIPRLEGKASPDLLFDHDAVLAKLCAARPVQPDARRLAYHAITGGFILGEIVERVTGQSIRDYLTDNIRKPLGLKYFNYGIEPASRDKVAINYHTGPAIRFPLSKAVERALGGAWGLVVDTSNDSRYYDAVIPAGNMYATADEASIFFEMLRNGGEYQGKRILEPRTVRAAIAEVGGQQWDRTMMMPMRFSAGMMLGAKPYGMLGPNTQHAYGHLGFMNILCWADPKREISASLLTTGKVLVSRHLQPWFGLLNQIANSCANP